MGAARSTGQGWQRDGHGALSPLPVATLEQQLVAILGAENVIADPVELATYDCDALTAYRASPRLAVLPSSSEQVAAVVKACAEHAVPVVARGAGTGLSGGALPHPEGVLVVLTRMCRILEIDAPNQRIVVEPGVTNVEVSRAVAEHQLYYAPDPSSQVVCTIGGNVAENSGGAHCLKYGFTTNHVLGLEVVLADGAVVDLGGSALETPGYDLRGAFVGSEGTLGIVTKITLRLLRTPESVRAFVAYFSTPWDAGEAVSAIVETGLLPAAVEMMDRLAVEACEAATGAGYDVEAGAALLVEFDGPEPETVEGVERAVALCRSSGATAVQVAHTAEARALLWKGRKAAFAAMGRMSPQYLVQDGVIPRTRLGECLARIADLAGAAGLRVANVFHAGDGNLHPLVLYEADVPGQTETAERLSTEIAELCVEFGGSLTGEHGVGIDKACSMPKMFSADDLEVMLRVRAAFDPATLLNPDKIFPTPRLCGERPGPYRPHPLEAAGVIERL